MGPNFDVSAPPTFVTGNSNKLESLNKIKLVVVDESVFVSHACSAQHVSKTESKSK